MERTGRIKCFMVEYDREKGYWINSTTREPVASPPDFMLPPGAMWYPRAYKFTPDGRKKEIKEALTVMTPGGIWGIDGSASNCTRKDDLLHQCWVRHGEPPDVTVDKNGDTCAAGAGSIMCGNYHGFLRNGFLEEC